MPRETDQSIGIISYGAYVPRLRMQRSAIVNANNWYSPELRAMGTGERSIASWDEDPITMATEAARDCLAEDTREDTKLVILASTTAPFAERQNAVIVKEALGLPDQIATLDVCGTRRAGISAMAQGFYAARGGIGNVLCIAADRPRGQPGSEMELSSGDAAAAFLIGTGKPLALCLGLYCESADFVDQYRHQDRISASAWEARWIRDCGYGELVPRAISAALSLCRVRATDIDFFVFPSALKGAERLAARVAGIREEAIVSDLSTSVGHCGTAYPLLLLTGVLDAAKPGQRILLGSLGSGCEVVVLEVTDAIALNKVSARLSRCLRRRIPDANYTRWLSFNGTLAMERSLRSAFEPRQSMSALWRNRKAAMGLVGMRCLQTDLVQFPPSVKGVHSEALGPYVEHRLADRVARVMSYTADHLTYSPNPPTYYGTVEFEGGGRMTVEFVDVEPGQLSVGCEVRMMFRIKSVDEIRGFIHYFWKATASL